jgi:hypothetical protein
MEFDGSGESLDSIPELILRVGRVVGEAIGPARQRRQWRLRKEGGGVAEKDHSHQARMLGEGESGLTLRPRIQR